MAAPRANPARLPATRDARRRGIACMLASAVLITLNDAVVKLLTAELPIGEVMFFRGLFTFVPLSLVVARSGGLKSLRVRDARSQAIRTACFVASTFLLMGGLARLPLSLAIFIVSAGPLFVTALAPALLKETVGWRRWTAVIAGFGGVLLITSPASGAFGWALLLPLGAAATTALADLVTRRMTATETSAAITVVSTLGVLAGSLATVALGWRGPSLANLPLLVLAGLLQGSGFFFMIEAFRYGEATIVAPLRYTTLVWAVLLGFLLWDDLPTWNALAGATAILGAALYIFHREAVHTGRAG